VSTFEEYAALARQLSEQLRAGERGAAAAAARRRALQATADQLDHRLAAQAERLDQLGLAIGGQLPPPPARPAETVDLAHLVPTGPAPDAPGSAPGGAAAAAQPGRAGVGAYPEGGGGQTRVALPAATTATAARVPAPRAPEVDPDRELAAARQLADDADRYGQQAAAIGQRPLLLPTWSPLARALAVYSACALAGAVLMLVLVVASGIGLVSGVTLGAWICAGLPVVSFVAGYLVLGRWGKPLLSTGGAPRFVPLGFVICVVLVPVAYCAYLVLVRALR
jgi:general stress protein CsbA